MKCKPAKRVPADFRIDEELKRWLRETRLMTLSEAEYETAKFKDHEFRIPKTDWRAAWRNWIRRAAEYRANQPRYSTTAAPVSQTLDDLAEDLGLRRRDGESNAAFAARVRDADVMARYGYTRH